MLNKESKVITVWVSPQDEMVPADSRGDKFPWSPVDHHGTFEKWIKFLETVTDDRGNNRLKEGWYFIWQNVE